MFNLKNHLMQKKANYEGVQGYFVAQTRAWQNCVCKEQGKGVSAQKAWQGCLEEYQKTDGKLEWVEKHCSDDNKIQKSAQSSDPQLQMGPYWERIKKKINAGKTTGQAVLETLEDCQKDAAKIPQK